MWDRIGRGALALALLAGIAPAAQGFLHGARSGSGGMSQAPAPEVTLSAGDRAAVADTPMYVDAIPVLTFHDIDDSSKSKYTVAPERFAEHMEALDQAGYHTVTLNQVEDLLAGRHPALPPRPILITFDDGAKTTWTHADPILARHGFNAVAFVITSGIGSGDANSSYYLDWPTVQKMEASGRWEIGGHTHDGHRVAPTATGDAPWLSNLLLDSSGNTETIDGWNGRVDNDLATNRQLIEDHLGVPVEAFAYPFSAATSPTNDDRIVDRLPPLVGTQFPLAFTNQSMPSAVVATDDPMLLPRLGSVTDRATPADVLTRIATSVPQAPPSDPSQLTWSPDGPGTCGTQERQVQVSTTQGAYSRCRPEVLHNDRWTDYALSITIDPAPVGATALVAIRDSPAGRAEVAIGTNSVVVRQLVAGTWSVFETQALPPTPDGTRHLTMGVTGDQLAVTVDGVEVPAATLAPSITQGLVSVGTVGGDSTGLRFTDVSLRVP